MISFCADLARCLRDMLWRKLRLPTKKIVVPINIPVYHSDLLKGRRAFITGGAKGIGYAIAEAFVRSGADVVITGRDKSALARACETLSKTGRRADYIILDNQDVGAITVAVNHATSKVGSIDILVNNAGVTGGGWFGETTESDWDVVFDTVLKGAYFLSQTFAEIWRDNGVKGNILNICSVSSLRPGCSPYMICKAAELSMTVGMAKMLIPYGIVVNGIGPGITNVKRLLPDSGEGISHQNNPSGRYSTVEEIANMAVVLVSDMGRMVVGDVVFVGGGAGVVTFDDIGHG